MPRTRQRKVDLKNLDLNKERNAHQIERLKLLSSFQNKYETAKEKLKKRRKTFN